MKGSPMSDSVPPRWDMSNVYPGLDSPQFAEATARRRALQADMDKLLTSLEILDARSDPDEVSKRINHLLGEIDKLLLLENTMGAYLHSFVSTDSFNASANRKQSEFERDSVQSDKLEIRLRALIGKIASLLPQITSTPGLVKEHEFWLNEVA